MSAEAKKKDISIFDGGLIVSEAATWKGTPYRLNGTGASKGAGGDCSGTTYKIYSAAGFPYSYQVAHDFPSYALKSGLFRELSVADQKQDGDILSWPNHLAIYSSFATDKANATRERINERSGEKWLQKNDMWTASKPDGPPYSAAEMKYWRGDAPRVFRYQK